MNRQNPVWDMLCVMLCLHLKQVSGCVAVPVPRRTVLAATHWCSSRSPRIWMAKPWHNTILAIWVHKYTCAIVIVRVVVRYRLPMRVVPTEHIAMVSDRKERLLLELLVMNNKWRMKHTRGESVVDCFRHG